MCSDWAAPPVGLLAWQSWLVTLSHGNGEWWMCETKGAGARRSRRDLSRTRDWKEKCESSNSGDRQCNGNQGTTGSSSDDLIVVPLGDISSERKSASRGEVRLVLIAVDRGCAEVLEREHKMTDNDFRK
jgi:hypothetical protein